MQYILSSVVRALSWSTALPQQPLHPYRHEGSDPKPSLASFGKIPGGSPLRFCNESRETDLYSIEKIELYPRPLYIDDTFEVHLHGTFLQNITENATWTWLARYGNSTEHETGTMDFCKSMDSIDQPDSSGRRECPPRKGFAQIDMSAWVMPMFIVPGNYYFKFDATTKEGERIYCLDAEIYLDYRDKNQEESAKVPGT